MANDPYWNNVVLAMHMDDTGLTDLKGHVVTLNGNVARSATQSKFGGYSAYFDGTGDYLTTPASEDFAFGSGDFTIEAYIYPTNSTAEQGVLTRWSTAATTNEAFFFGIRPGGVLVLLLSSTGQYQPANDIVSSTGAVTYNAWNHIACCRSDDNIYMYVNGLLVKTTTFSGSVYASTLATSVGASVNAANPFFGYIDDVRITKGVARHTANFTAPTEAFPNTPPQLIGTIKDSSGTFVSRPVIAIPRNRAAVAYAGISDATSGAFTLPAYDDSSHAVIALPVEGDPYWDSVVLAMHMDGTNGSTTFTDEKGHTVTAYGNAQISTTQSKFGGVSAYFDGTGDYISIASSLDYAFSSGDFTVEFFVRFSVVPGAGGYVALLSKQNAAGNEQSFTLWYGGTEKWFFNYSASGTSTAGSSSGLNGNTPSVGTWYNIALVRTSNQLNLFVNGVRGTAFAMNGNAIYGGSAPLLVGAANALSPAYFINGYIDDLRITKGVARYIHNFTPPSSAFPHAVSGVAENALILDNITPV